MWKVDARQMCRRHLLGEHVELHMFVASLNAGRNLDGFLRRGLFEIHSIRRRHEAIVREMLRRGYRHASPLPQFSVTRAGKVSVAANVLELARRCAECRQLLRSQQPHRSRKSGAQDGPPGKKP